MKKYSKVAKVKGIREMAKLLTKRDFYYEHHTPLVRDLLLHKFYIKDQTIANKYTHEQLDQMLIDIYKLNNSR